MQAAARPYVLASAALLATNMVVATPLVARQLTPLVARQLQPPVRSLQTRLVDADISGVDAIPYNLFEDISTSRATNSRRSTRSGFR